MFPSTQTNSKAGKATPATSQLCFFNQIVGGPNPLNPREMVVQVIPGSGISARDYFAAKALATCNGSWDAGFPDTARDVAAWCYRVADAMLEARKPVETSIGFPPVD